MEFKLKQLSDVLRVTKIANVHFFEFENKNQTPKDKHPFCELLFSYSGTITVDGDSFKGKLKKGEMIIHSANETHSLSTHKNKKTTAVILGFECNSPHLKYFSEQ
jgi:quercetin dioxygenase-like cupin family protein